MRLECEYALEQGNFLDNVQTAPFSHNSNPAGFLKTGIIKFRCFLLTINFVALECTNQWR